MTTYSAVGLIPEITEIQQRNDITTNLDHLYALTHTAVFTSPTSAPAPSACPEPRRKKSGGGRASTARTPSGRSQTPPSAASAS